MVAFVSIAQNTQPDDPRQELRIVCIEVDRPIRSAPRHPWDVSTMLQDRGRTVKGFLQLSPAWLAIALLNGCTVPSWVERGKMSVIQALVEISLKRFSSSGCVS